jgi:hypothetical protein
MKLNTSNEALSPLDLWQDWQVLPDVEYTTYTSNRIQY